MPAKLQSQASTLHKGSAAEDLAVHYLAERGYRVLARNFRIPQGEVDIVAMDGDVLVFVEVRSRAETTFGEPLETIDRRKISRVVKAARAYLETLEGVWPEMRFDAVGITGDLNSAGITLVKGAFEVTP